jgi:hypothetical protein
VDDEERPKRIPRLGWQPSSSQGNSATNSAWNRFGTPEEADAAAPKEDASPDISSETGGISEASDESFKALYAETRQRRFAIRHLLAAGEEVNWDAEVVCTSAPEGAAPTPNNGNLLVTDRRLVYAREGAEPVVLNFSDIEPVSIRKIRRGAKAISVVAKSGSEWTFEGGSLAVRAIKRYTKKGR